LGGRFGPSRKYTLESFNAIAQPLEFRRAVLQAAEVAPNLRTALSERERVA